MPKSSNTRKRLLSRSPRQRRQFAGSRYAAIFQLLHRGRHSSKSKTLSSTSRNIKVSPSKTSGKEENSSNSKLSSSDTAKSRPGNSKEQDDKKTKDKSNTAPKCMYPLKERSTRAANTRDATQKPTIIKEPMVHLKSPSKSVGVPQATFNPVEEALYNWYSNKFAKGCHVTTGEMWSAAQRFGKVFGKPIKETSTEWLNSFMKCRKINLAEKNSLRKVTTNKKRVSDGEGGSGDGLPAGPSMAESSPNFLTCAPLLASMSGLQHGSRLSGTDDDDSRHHPDVKPDVPLLIDDVDEGESHLNNQASGEESSMPSPPSQGLSGPYLLKKETHCTTILDQLLKDQDYADVTLTAEGRSIFAHKMVLCLASSYFRQVLAKDSNVRSVIVFRDIKFAELKNIINFVYTGEATVDAADLESFMKTAESLEISSLCENEKTVPQQLRSSPSKEPARSSAPETDKPTRIAAKSPMRLSVGLPPQKRKLNNQSPSKRSKHQARFQPVSPTPGPDLSLVKPEPDGVFECEEPEIGCSPPASPRRTQDPPLALTGPDKAPPGRCPFCTASSEFYEGTAIQNHLRTNHPDKTAFPCVACARVFLKKGLFEVHKADCVR